MVARRSLIIVHCLLLVALLLSACSSPPTAVVTPAPTTLRLVAADACGPLMEELAVAYQAGHPWATVEVEVFNSTVAQERLEAGTADVAALSWLGDGAGLWAVPFATDAVAVIVHPSVAVEGLDLETLREILNGRIGEWDDGVPVQVVSREAGAGVRAVVEAAVMDGYDVTLISLVVPDSAGMLAAVASTPGAIGYVSQARLDGDVRVVPVDGVLPVQALGDGTPLVYPLFLVTPGEPTGEVRTFIQWVLGQDGQEWVTRRFGSP